MVLYKCTALMSLCVLSCIHVLGEITEIAIYKLNIMMLCPPDTYTYQTYTYLFTSTKLMGGYLSNFHIIYKIAAIDFARGFN